MNMKKGYIKAFKGKNLGKIVANDLFEYRAYYSGSK